MPFRAIEPNEIGPVKIPRQFTPEEVKEILANIDTDVDPALVEQECLELLDDPEKRISADHVLAQVKAIIDRSDHGV